MRVLTNVATVQFLKTRILGSEPNGNLSRRRPQIHGPGKADFIGGGGGNEAEGGKNPGMRRKRFSMRNARRSQVPAAVRTPEWPEPDPWPEALGSRSVAGAADANGSRKPETTGGFFSGQRVHFPRERLLKAFALMVQRAPMNTVTKFTGIKGESVKRSLELLLREGPLGGVGRRVGEIALSPGELLTVLEQGLKRKDQARAKSALPILSEGPSLIPSRPIQV